MIDKRVLEFANAHRHDDIQRLLLSSSRYPDVDIRLAATLINAGNKIRKKVPSWDNSNDLYFPNNLSVEQASSELTASYKMRFVDGGVVADLTGGIGVDSYFLSKNADRHIYFERNPEICKAAEHNFRVLGLTNIYAANIEISEENIDSVIDDRTELIYLDPARRDDNKRRVCSIADSQPNILLLKDSLFKKTEKILVKVSPMVDISASIRLLEEITEIHVLSVNNECKELLFLLERKRVGRDSEKHGIKVFTVNFCKGDKAESFGFDYYKEGDSTSWYSTDELNTYLYEPNSSILKSGAFKSVGEFYGLNKLHVNTHLYTSDISLKDFPGRSFIIEEVFDFKKDVIKNLRNRYPKANISTRNFPLTPVELKKTLRIEDGGEHYIFGCTLSSGIRKILICSKLY